MTSSRRSRLAVLTVVVALLHVASIVDAAELCFGIDGHVALEDNQTFHQPAGIMSPAVDPRIDTDSAGRDHGACLDVVAVAGHDTGAAAKVVPAPAASAPAVDGASAWFDAVDVSSSELLPTFACLRSTVLRV